MKIKSNRKLAVWTGIISVGLMTIGLPLFFIGGSGQKVNSNNIVTRTYAHTYEPTTGDKVETEMQINPNGQPDAFFVKEGDKNTVPNAAIVDVAENDIRQRIAEINEGYNVVKNNVKSSGFFEIQKLNNETVAAIESIGSHLLWIRDNNVFPFVDGTTKNENYNLSSSLYDIQQQLDLIVRVDSTGSEINNVLGKNVSDNSSLAISGIVFSAVGAFGSIGVLTHMFLKKKENY